MSATHLGTWTRLGGFTLPLLLLGGCGGPGDGDASSSQRAEITGFEQSPPGSRAVIIAPEKAMSFRKATGATKSGLCCGLLNWGDLDGDSLDDVIVAYARKSGLRTDLGWIEAWSVAKRERIWQVTGVPTDWTDRKNPIPGYALGLIAKIGDVDGDGIADVYCQEQFNKPVMLCSGRTGTMIERRDSQRSGTFAEPIRVQDADGDGAPDLWFVATHPPGLVVHATRGGKHVQNFALHWPGIAAKPTVTVAIPRFTDANSDGVEELLLYCMVPNPGAKVAQLELAIIDGASLQLLHRFRTPAPRVTGTTTHAAPGDLTGDGLPDIVKASVCGEGEEGRTSFLKLIDGSTGTVVWTVTGDKAGGVEGFAVNLKTKDKEETAV